MTAYNYKTQEWKQGQEGTALRLEQLRGDLATLRGPRGAEYLKFCGRSEALDSVIRRTEWKIIECERELTNTEAFRICGFRT